MRQSAIQTLLMLVLISLSGCMDPDPNGVEYTPETHEFTFTVSDSGETIPLYTLNDGTSKMNVAAVTFTDDLEGQTPMVPGPEIRVKEGDTVIIHLLNTNPLPHTLHLHGGLIPWEMDGVPFLTQPPVMQGESFTYTFEDLKAGTYFYHCHVDVAHHMDLGMYGSFIVEEREPTFTYDNEFVLLLDEWDNCHVHGNTDPVTNGSDSNDPSQRSECSGRFFNDNFRQNQQGNVAQDPACEQLSPGDPTYDALNCGSAVPQQDTREWYYMTFPEYTPVYNTFLINGKAFPDTLPLVVTEGEVVKLRFINAGEEVHSMHLHGHYYTVTHKDGFELASPYNADTLLIAPGERYDVIFTADNPGYWAFHDHIGLNVMNDNISPGGMFTCVAYDDFHGRDAHSFDRSLDCMDEAVKIFQEEGIATEPI